MCPSVLASTRPLPHDSLALIAKTKLHSRTGYSE